jgi:hypothetical protein
MDITQIKFSLILTAILVVSAFMPILNILIMLFNGVVLSVFGDNSNVTLWANLALSLVLIVIFYLSKKKTASAIIEVSIVLFLFPLFMYVFENRLDDDSPYFMQSLIGGVLTGVVLIITEYSKRTRTT